MQRLNYLLLAGIVTLAGLVGWGITHTLLIYGYSPIVLTPLLSILFFGIAIYLLVQGRNVLKLKRHQETKMTSLGAFRVAIMAHSSAYTGALFLGLLVSQLFLGAEHWEAPLLRANAIYAGVNSLGALCLLIAALIVERWCVIDDDEDENNHEPVTREGLIRPPRRATSRTDSSLS